LAASLRRRQSMEIKDVLEMGRRLRNWGRWGPEDELGTLNFITVEYR
jgi:hypothetical protein